MASRKCESVATLKYEVDSIRAELCQTETEESWDTIARAILTLTALCTNGACEFPVELLAAVRTFSRPLNSAMNSERTKLSGAAIDLISSLATGLETAFDSLLPLFFPTLLTLCTRTNKVFTTRARTCIFTIIETTQLPSILTYFLQSLKDKSVTLRLAAADGVLACLNCFNPPELEKEARARDIEAVIRATARDANADIRKTSRKIFEAYKVLLPNRVDNFTGPLSPTMKKYLDIKPKPIVISNPVPRLKTCFPSMPELPAKATLSASTSALPPKSSTSTGSSNAGKSEGTTILHAPRKVPTHVVAPVKASDTMPPPDYIPVRPPTQPPKRLTPAARVPNDRTRAISTSSGYASRVLPSATAAGVGAARRINQVPTQASVTAATSAPMRPRRPVAIPTSSDGLLRPLKAGNGDITAPGSSQIVVGARRVPMPEKDLEKEPRRGGRPISRGDNNSTTTTSTNTAHKGDAVRDTKPATRVMMTTKTDEKAGTGQLRNNKTAVAERNAESAKPGWGRPVHRRIISTSKGVTGKEKVPEKAKQLASRNQLEKVKPQKIKPETVPLPPSPTRKTPTPTQMPHSSSLSAEPRKVGSCESGDEQIPSAETETLPPTALDECAPPPHPVTPPPPIAAGPVQQPNASQDPKQPFTPSPSTPISNLLSSIQRGFIFTPSSPLSPPESYLSHKSGVAITFPPQGLMREPNRENEVKEFGEFYGLGKVITEEGSRLALTEVVVNQ